MQYKIIKVDFVLCVLITTNAHEKWRFMVKAGENKNLGKREYSFRDFFVYFMRFLADFCRR